MKRRIPQKKKELNVEDLTIQNQLDIDNLTVEIYESNREFHKPSLQQESQDNSEDIYDKTFEGKIYTFYSLNLRHLFTSKIEEQLDKILKMLLENKKKCSKNWLNSPSSANKKNYDKNKEKIERIIEKLLELRRNANMFLANRDYNYFAKNLEIVLKDSVEYEALLNQFNIEPNNGNFEIIKNEFNADSSKLKPFAIFDNKKEKGFYVIENKTEELKKELKNGILLSIFRHNLTEDWLGGNYFKIYQIDESELKAGVIKEKESVPTYHIRLSKLGVLEIRKEERYSSNENLKDSMKTLVGFEDRNTFKNKPIAEITYNFCKHIETQINQAFKLSDFHKRADENYRRIEAKTWTQLFDEKNEYTDIPSLTRLDRQRYIVIVINNIRGISKDKEQEYISKQALTILEGRFLTDNNDDFKIPKVVSKIGVPKDMSTWADELCFFSAERSLIYFNKGKGSYPKGIQYENYWDCIIRGIEFSCLIRMALRIIESTSRKMVHHIPDRLIDFDDEKFEEVKKKIRQLEVELAHFLELVPEIRSASNAVNSFRSERNVKKFDVLQEECFGFKKILENIQKNIDDLTHFVTFFERQRLQKTIQEENNQRALDSDKSIKEERKLTIIALYFTITSVIYICASFMQDLYTFLSAENFSLSAENFGVDGVSSVKFLIFFTYLLVLAIAWFIIKKIEPKFSFKEVPKNSEEKATNKKEKEAIKSE